MGWDAPWRLFSRFSCFCMLILVNLAKGSATTDRTPVSPTGGFWWIFPVRIDAHTYRPGCPLAPFQQVSMIFVRFPLCYLISLFGPAGFVFPTVSSPKPFSSVRFAVKTKNGNRAIFKYKKETLRVNRLRTCEVVIDARAVPAFLSTRTQAWTFLPAL